MKNLLIAMLAGLTLVSVQLQAADASALAGRISNAAGRPDADKARDAGRKPAEVVTFLGIQPGMTVVDLVAAAGYYTEVLSVAVGPRGKVYMQNSPASLTGNRGERTAAAIDERLANNRLANVERLNRAADDLGLADNSLDAAIIALEFHELYRSDNPNATAEFLAEMRRVLKPGGVLGIIEHAGSPPYPPADLHRALESQVVADVQKAGLFVEASGKMLRNINDDHSEGVFAATIRGQTDRFVLKVVKRR
jgi:predicted methyltransferase